MDEDRALLEKIDILRRRAKVSYRKAEEVLVANGGDVVRALIALEDERAPLKEQIQVRGGEVLQRVRELLREGNVRRIVIKKNGARLAEIPVTIGVAGAILAPQLAALSAILAVAARYTIEVERADAGGEGGSELE